MDSEIIGALIAAFATLVSAVISAWVALRVERIKVGGGDAPLKPSNTITVVVWAIAGALIGAAITLFLLGQFPFSSKYDDFNNPLYNNSINPEKWKRLQDLNCDVSQQNGVAQFEKNEISGEDNLCFVRMPTKVAFAEVGQMDARLQAKNDADGEFSLTTIEFQTTGFSAETIWIAQCGIIQRPNEDETILFFYLDNSYPNGNPETYIELPAANNEWYKMRLEIDPDTGTTRCYANDKVIGSHRPSNVGVLKTQLFNRHITGFWAAQSTGSYIVDDVSLRP